MVRNYSSAKVTRIVDDVSTALKVRVGDRICAWYERKKLRRTDFSIICNNCLAWGIYHKMGLQYTTPTVGLFFYSEDYINFLENFEYYIRQPLKFTHTSKHPEANELRKTIRYPIGILGDDVEIQFLHYEDESEVANNWARRTKRINFDNLFFIYGDGELFREEFLHRYQELPFVHKIFFSSKPRRNYECVVFIRDYANVPHCGDMTRNRKYEKYLDLTKWLNGDSDFLKRS